MEEFCRGAMKRHGDSVATDLHRIDTTSMTYLAAPPAIGEFVVKFVFANASFVSFEFMQQYSEQRYIMRCAPLPLREEFVVFDRDEFSRDDDEQVCDDMSRVLENLIMTPNLRQRVRDMALVMLYTVIKTMPRSHNHILIKICAFANFRIDFGIEMPFFEDELLKDLEVEKYVVRGIDAATCAICLKDFVHGCKYVFTACGHKFHRDCINQWLGVSCSGRRCPICRHTFDQFALAT
ncbi:hypothetical protein MIMGU_mgv1a022027mg, partial [Erythranthe guttata]